MDLELIRNSERVNGKKPEQELSCWLGNQKRKSRLRRKDWNPIMATSVAHYDVAQDGAITLGAGSGQDPDHDIALNTPDIIAGDGSVLTYMVDPGVAGVNLSIQPAGTAIIPATPLVAGSGYVRQEVITAPAAGSSLRIVVTAGSVSFAAHRALVQKKRLAGRAESRAWAV
jgi:hypothetical protein